LQIINRFHFLGILFSFEIHIEITIMISQKIKEIKMTSKSTTFKTFLYLVLSAVLISFSGFFNSSAAQQNTVIDPDVYSVITNPQNSVALPLVFNFPKSTFVFQGDNILVDTMTLNANPGPSNNGGSAGWAIFFDLIALGSNNIIVTQMSTANSGVANANFSVEVLTYDGTALGGPVGSGHGSSTAGWTSLGTVPAVQGSTSNGVSLIFSVPPIFVPAGDTTGVALKFSAVGPRYYGTTTGPYDIYSDLNLKLVTGDARTAPFTTSGLWFSPRSLCGVVRYVLESPSCNFVWSSQTSGITTAFNTVEAVNDMVGWAAGANGVVRKTTDGGLTWTAASTTGQINGTAYCMDAFDANTAFVSSSPSTGTFIYKTTNGGANWTQVFSQTGGFLDGIQMLNANTGYAMGDPVSGVWTILQTTNGGDNWTQMPSAPTQVGTEAGWNNSFQLVGNNMWFGTNNSKLYGSTNLGLNWASGPITGQANSYALHFNSATLGINVGTIAQITTNGGSNWTTTTGTVPGTGNMLAAEGFGTSTFWIGRGTGIYMTTNLGDNWAAVPGITVAGSVYAMDFAIVGGCPTGWAVTSTGNIYAMKIITGVSGEPANNVPKDYILSQNYPNPFNPSTKISFSLPQANNVKLVVYDLQGKEVATLVNSYMNAGNHSVEFNASSLASGVYLYRIEAGSFTAAKKMILVK
jgi:photosystem II stability/assembly factor-like uncharacterized protein